MNDMMKRNILVVDDSATMRMYLKLTIKKIMGGVSVTEAVNGLDALSKMEGRDFDLVLTDMMMPEMDGAQLTNRIRKALNRTTPIIIITTKGEEEVRDYGLSQGANTYITKPVNVNELRDAVLNFLPQG